MENIQDYPALDFSPLLGENRYGVICRSEEDAIHLLAALKVQYPDCCRMWQFPYVNWYADDDYQEYFPRINTGLQDLEYATAPWGADHGYVMIEFSDLLMTEFEPFESTEIPLSFLLGDGGESDWRDLNLVTGL